MAQKIVTRFCIGKEGRICSGVWRIYRHKDSIYLHPSNTGGGAKFSLHDGENGRRYRFAATPDWMRTIVGGNGSRPPIVFWERRATPSVGISHALTILFVSELLRARDDAVDPNVRMLGFPKSGKAIQVDVAFTFENPTTITTTEHQTILGYTSLSSGENCVVMACVSDFDFDKFKVSANLTWPVDKTVTLTQLDDPDLSCVLVGKPGGHGLPVIEISNVVFRQLNTE